MLRFLLKSPGLNRWIREMNDYFKDSIVKFILIFENDLENNANRYNDDEYQVLCLEWGNLTILNNLYFINFDICPKNDNGYFVT